MATTRTSPQLLHRWAGLALLLVLTPAALHAEPAPAPAAAPDESRARARELFKQGVAAQQREDWQGAYAAFSQAWALTEHYQIAGNLGSVEIELARYRDAAEHLSFALREMKAAGASQAREIEALQGLLDQASTKVARIAPSADWLGIPVRNGSLVIDGRATELADTVFVQPGTRVVQVRAAGARSAEQRVELAAGQQRNVAFALRLSPTEQTRAADQSVMPGPSGIAEADGAQGRPAWPWIVGASLAAAATGLGIGAVVAAGGAGDEAGKLADQIGASASLDAHVVCGQPAGAADGSCDSWQSALHQNGTWWGVAAASFVVAGAAAVGTVLYVAWPEDSQDPRGARVELQLQGPSARLRVRF